MEIVFALNSAGYFHATLYKCKVSSGNVCLSVGLSEQTNGHLSVDMSWVLAIYSVGVQKIAYKFEGLVWYVWGLVGYLEPNINYVYTQQVFIRLNVRLCVRLKYP